MSVSVIAMAFFAIYYAIIKRNQTKKVKAVVMEEDEHTYTQ